MDSNVRKRVLVVDDERAVREVLAEHLALHALDVDLAANATQALDLFQKHKYDLITLDFRMPGMDGLKLHFVMSKGFGYGKRTSELIPQRLPPVLVITGNAHDPEIAALLAGENVAGVLEKPIHHKLLIEAVSQILDSSQQRKESHGRIAKILGPRAKQ